MSEISLESLRELYNNRKAPTSLWVKNTSHLRNGRKIGPRSVVIISVYDRHGKENAIKIDATIKPTNILNQASFIDIIQSTKFSTAVENGLIEVIDSEEAKTITDSAESKDQLSARRRIREVNEDVQTENSSEFITKTKEFNNDIITEPQYRAYIEKYKDSLSPDDISEAMSILIDTSCLSYALLTELQQDPA